MDSVKIGLSSLPFVANIPTIAQYTDIGLGELAEAAESMVGDYTEILSSIELLFPIINQDLYSDDELWDDIFTIKSSPKLEGGRSVDAIYGGTVKRIEDRLVLSFGKKAFPITQNGKSLSIGALSGDIKIEEKKEEGKTTKYYLVSWTAHFQDGDNFHIFSFPILIKKEKGNDGVERTIAVTENVLLRDIAPKNGLIHFVAEANAGGDGQVYGTIHPKKDGESIYKPSQLFDGIETQTFRVIGVRVSRGVKKTNGEEFDSLLAQLSDGRKANLNSDAQAFFLGLSDEHRHQCLPMDWQVTKYEEGKTKTKLVSPEDSKTVGATKLSPRLAALRSASAISRNNIAPSPVKSAALVGGSSADFDKLVEAQTDDIPEDDIPF